jgi:hypothetical protein
MSKLIEELQKVDRTSSQPIGFMTSRQVTAGPRLRLIAAAVPEENIAAEFVDGADAALLLPGKTRPSVTSIKSSVEPFGGIPWGIYLKDVNSGTISSLTKEGCDFFIFPAASQVSAITSDDDTGKIIEVESSLDDGLIRAINSLPVDAVMLSDTLDKKSPLVWHKLMVFQHLTNLITKPVIISVTPEAAESDIKALWEAGADGIITEINTTKPDGIKNLRKLIDGLPARKLPKKGSSEVLLPYSREAKTSEPEPEVEEEDWE